MTNKSEKSHLEDEQDEVWHNRFMTNFRKLPIEVRHADLKRWTPDAAFGSVCPKCKEGKLTMNRDKTSLILDANDHCISCGQRFVYSDILNVRLKDRNVNPLMKNEKGI